MATKLPPPFVVGETYLDRDGEYNVIASRGSRVLFQRPDGNRGEADLQTKARIHKSIVAEKNGPTVWRQAGAPNSGIFSKLFPIIEEIIDRHSSQSKDYMLHGRIVEALLEDSDGHKILERASSHDREQRSIDWWASNMIQHFSKSITEDFARAARTHQKQISQWGSKLERIEIERAWAYRVRRG